MTRSAQPSPHPRLRKASWILLVILFIIYLIAWGLDCYPSGNSGGVPGFLCFISSNAYFLKTIKKILLFKFHVSSELWIGISHLSNFTYWVGLYYLVRYQDFWKSAPWMFASILLTLPIAIIAHQDWFIGFYLWYGSFIFSYLICDLNRILYQKPIKSDDLIG
jgi:hypothetical protein